MVKVRLCGDGPAAGTRPQRPAGGRARGGHRTPDALTDHAPDFAEGWNALATAYFQAGEYGPSVEDIGKTLTLNPRHFGALSGLGMILEELGDSEGALAAYKAALAIHPQLETVKASVERLEADAAGQEL